MNQMSRVLGAMLLSLAACSVGQGEGVDSSEAAQNANLCGNGTRDVGEQCDDSNTSNLDGCSATCAVEHTHRLDSVQMMFGTDSFCTKNALGSAVKGVAQGQLQNGLSKAIADGSASLFLAFIGLDDLSGHTAGAITLGSFVGAPVSGVGLDALFTAKSEALKTDNTPIVSFPGAIGSGGALTAGPGNFAFTLALSGTPLNVNLSNTRAKAQLGAATTPTGHLTSENLDPTITSFATTSGGQLCGNISAASLAAVPVPDALTGGTIHCSQGYTSANSMLDVFVGGCKVIFMTALGGTQPDEVDPTAPVAGAGGSYTLQAGSDHKVNGCKDSHGASVDLATCLGSAAYSVGFKFTSQRVVVRGLTP